MNRCQVFRGRSSSALVFDVRLVHPRNTLLSTLEIHLEPTFLCMCSTQRGLTTQVESIIAMCICFFHVLALLIMLANEIHIEFQSEARQIGEFHMAVYRLMCVFVGSCCNGLEEAESFEEWRIETGANEVNVPSNIRD